MTMHFGFLFMTIFFPRALNQSCSEDLFVYLFSDAMVNLSVNPLPMPQIFPTEME